jgi:hypothetical protein
VIGILLATRFLPPPEPRTPRPIDVPGFLLTAIAFSGIIFGLSVISLPAISAAYGYGAVLVGVLAGAGYWWHTRRTEFPLLDPKLFRNRLFRTAVLGGTFFRIGIGAFPFLMPLMLQLTFGLTPFESGLTTFVAAFGAMVSKFGATRLYARFGFAVAGGILEASVQLRGAPLDLADFHIAWFIVAALAMISAVQFLRLPPDAGSNVSGHRLKPLAKEEAIA